MSERGSHVLTSPGFLACLGALLANDFVLKQQLHNALTGKLSDFAGLFVFPLFWAALFPRLRTQIYSLTALAFALWKSPHSQPLVDAWNGLRLLQIGRTVDPTDLFALLVLPCSYLYGRARASSLSLPRSTVYPVALISLFAFTATSFSEKISFSNEYYFHHPARELIERMRLLSADDVPSPSTDSAAGVFDVHFDSCTGAATITVREESGWTVITLKEINYRCPSGKREEMRVYFEREFIDRLREEPVRKSSQVRYVFPAGPPAAATPEQPASSASPSTQ